MVCPHCDKNIDPESIFCPLCGKPVAPQNQNDSEAKPTKPIFVPSPTDSASNESENTEPTRKKNIKQPLIIMAIILVLAIIISTISFALSKSTHLKLLEAAKSTAFNSSYINITIKTNYNDSDYGENAYQKYVIAFDISEDIESSRFRFQETGSYKHNGEEYKTDNDFLIENGIVYENNKEICTVSEYIDQIEKELEKKGLYLDIEEKEINKILNGKIDEKEFEKFLNKTIAPAIEDMVEKTSDKKINLPKYKYIFETVTDLLKEKSVIEHIELKKTSSDLPGKTYKYTIDTDDLAETVLDYAKEDRQYKKLLETLAEEWNCETDEAADRIADEIGDTGNITGTITIDANKITSITIEAPYSDEVIEISIESK